MTPPDAHDPEFVIVAAVAANGVIGRDGEIPWYFPEDLRHFKQLTTGHPVVMGRRTYESIAADLGGPLPDRTNIVLSRSAPDLPEAVRLVGSVPEAVDAVRATGTDVGYVIGGAGVYEAFLPRTSRMVLTEIHEEYEGDTYFPEVDMDAWQEVARDEQGQFDFVTYERK